MFFSLLTPKTICLNSKLLLEQTSPFKPIVVLVVSTVCFVLRNICEMGPIEAFWKHLLLKVSTKTKQKTPQFATCVAPKIDFSHYALGLLLTELNLMLVWVPLRVTIIVLVQWFNVGSLNFPLFRCPGFIYPNKICRKWSLLKGCYSMTCAWMCHKLYFLICQSLKAIKCAWWDYGDVY